MNHYATFWQRFGAIWIDFLILLPFALLSSWVESYSKAAAIALVIPMAASYLAYSIYCHGRFGQTVGKRVMGIRVVRLTGERIGWREAWLRSSIDVLFASLGVIGSFVALAAISDADYYGVGWMRRGLDAAWGESGRPRTGLAGLDRDRDGDLGLERVDGDVVQREAKVAARFHCGHGRYRHGEFLRRSDPTG